MSAFERLKELHQYDDATEECKTCHVGWQCDTKEILEEFREMEGDRDFWKEKYNDHECNSEDEHECREDEYHDALDKIDDIVRPFFR